jgi:hypothetical protein
MFFFGFWVLACGIFLIFFPGLVLRADRGA